MKTTKSTKKKKRIPQPPRRFRIGHAHDEDGTPIRRPNEEEEDRDDRHIDDHRD